MQGTIGGLEEAKGEMEVHWKIHDFFSLSDTVDEYYYCPDFYFASVSWRLQMYPNGESKYNSAGYVGIYIYRGSSGPSVSLKFTLGVKKKDGQSEIFHTGEENVYDEKRNGWGKAKFLSRSVLLQRKSELAPSDVLTVTCCLKHNDPSIVASSYFTRLLNVAKSFKEIFTKQKRTDTVLKLKGKDILAHKLILGSRSLVFSSMFSHDTKEERTGEVDIEDVDSNAFQNMLSYIYSGEVDELSPDNAIQIYQVADRYDLKELKELCVAFMEKNMCEEEHVCNVIKLADSFCEEELGRVARGYFITNAKKIVSSESWRLFYKENQALALELFIEKLAQD